MIFKQVITEITEIFLKKPATLNMHISFTTGEKSFKLHTPQRKNICQAKHLNQTSLDTTSYILKASSKLII